MVCVVVVEQEVPQCRAVIRPKRGLCCGGGTAVLDRYQTQTVLRVALW